MNKEALENHNRLLIEWAVKEHEKGHNLQQILINYELIIKAKD